MDMACHLAFDHHLIGTDGARDLACLGHDENIGGEIPGDGAAKFDNAIAAPIALDCDAFVQNGTTFVGDAAFPIGRHEGFAGGFGEIVKGVDG